tara:strand:- start:155 stop:442 length:288 start_codon:yes stop_codon:yes gene_type:complete
MENQNHSKYYYDYTRNMSEEQIKNSPCGRPVCHCCKGASECPHEVCECKDHVGPSLEAWTESVKRNKIGLDVFIDELESCEKEGCENDPNSCSDC